MPHLPLYGYQYAVHSKNQTFSTLPPFLCSPIGHDLNTLKKKSNYLGKSIDSLIAPNEYTLDLFTSPQFFVGLLDSQISANSVSVGRNRHEKFHMIHTTSLENSIWQEDVYSNILFKIKVGKTFLRSPRKRIPFILRT